MTMRISENTSCSRFILQNTYSHRKSFTWFSLCALDEFAYDLWRELKIFIRTLLWFDMHPVILSHQKINISQADFTKVQTMFG